VHKRVIEHWTHSQLSSLLTTHDIDRSDVRAICIRELYNDFETHRVGYIAKSNVNTFAQPLNFNRDIRILDDICVIMKYLKFRKKIFFLIFEMRIND